jgi:hypothetical protein
MQPDPLDPPDAQRAESPLVLEPAELAFDGGALPVEQPDATGAVRQN